MRVFAYLHFYEGSELSLCFQKAFAYIHFYEGLRFALCFMRIWEYPYFYEGMARFLHLYDGFRIYYVLRLFFDVVCLRKVSDTFRFMKASTYTHVYENVC